MKLLRWTMALGLLAAGCRQAEERSRSQSGPKSCRDRANCHGTDGRRLPAPAPKPWLEPTRPNSCKKLMDFRFRQSPRRSCIDFQRRVSEAQLELVAVFAARKWGAACGIDVSF